MVKLVQAELAENQKALQQKNIEIRNLSEQIKEIKENESLTKDTVIEELKAKYEKSLEKKRGAKKKLKEELYDKEEEIESAQMQLLQIA